MFLHILCIRTQNLPQETPLTKHDKQQGLIQLFTLWIVSSAQGGGHLVLPEKTKNGLFVVYLFGLRSLPEKTTKNAFLVWTEIIARKKPQKPFSPF